MSNYPEESSRPLSTMECQNAVDQIISETVQPKAVAEYLTDIATQYKQFAEQLKSKSSDDMSVGELMANSEAQAKRKAQLDALEKAADECGVDMTGMLDDMREAAGLPTEDKENIPTLTKETIDAATEAFLDEEDVDEVTKADCTDFCEEDAPDDGVAEPTPLQESLNKISEFCQNTSDPTRGSDEWIAKTALEYMQYRQVGQNNLDEPASQNVIDDVYSELNEQQRLFMIGMAPWLESAFKDATTRAINRKRE